MKQPVIQGRERRRHERQSVTGPVRVEKLKPVLPISDAEVIDVSAGGIAIRTAVVKDGMLYVQAGAGIVHDSVPESEWVETNNKARAVLRAADMVQQGLDAEES